MKGNQELLLETVRKPDMILQGTKDELRGVKFFPETHLGPKHLMAAYKEIGKEDGFIVTAYKTSKIEKIHLSLSRDGTTRLIPGFIK